MKIGLVRRGYSSTGGAEAFLMRFTAAVLEAGHDVTLFTTRRWPRNQWPREIHRLEGSSSPLRFADALLNSKAVDRCDVMFSFERVYSCDCYRAGDGVHRAWLERRAKFEPWYRSFFRRFNDKHRHTLRLERELFGDGGAHIVIANSHMVKQEIEQHYEFPSEQIQVIYNGIPADAIPADREAMRAAARAALGLDDDAYVLLFAGSGWERKGLRWAIEALKKSSLDATLLVAGRGDADEMPHSSRVVYLGPVDDMPRLLAAADVFILPTMYDPFSNASLEALAAGLPVITTRDNGCSEIIEPGVDGDVVNRCDAVEELAAAILHWSDRTRRETMRPALVAKGAQFTIEENVRKTLEVLMKGAKFSA